MGRYRKRPVEIEARQFTEETKDQVLHWVGATRASAVHNDDGSPALAIWTLEGKLLAQLGDYVICGIQGEFYPCKPDIFEATYEAVEEVPA